MGAQTNLGHHGPTTEPHPPGSFFSYSHSSLSGSPVALRSLCDLVLSFSSRLGPLPVHFGADGEPVVLTSESSSTKNKGLKIAPLYKSPPL